ncbi:MAG: hypothetical protein ACTSWQ_05850 [Candidatus Thorarchaeota archaeon]
MVDLKYLHQVAHQAVPLVVRHQVVLIVLHLLAVLKGIACPVVLGEPHRQVAQVALVQWGIVPVLAQVLKDIVPALVSVQREIAAAPVSLLVVQLLCRLHLHHLHHQVACVIIGLVQVIMFILLSGCQAYLNSIYNGILAV